MDTAAHRNICLLVIDDHPKWLASMDTIDPAERLKHFASDVTYRQHRRAFTHSGLARQGIVAALTALAGYADAFHRETGTPLGTDCVLGASWITALRSVLELRNGPLYGLDAGMLGTLASKIALRAGFDRSVLREGF